jgi:hypothetical protein
MFSSDQLLSALRGETEYGYFRNEISEAKIVTFMIGGNTAEGIVLNHGVTDIRKALARALVCVRTEVQKIFVDN